MNLATKKLKDLIPAGYNPRKGLQPGDPEYESLKKSIKRWGLVEPIVWNKHTGHVCGGHQRLKVLMAEGVKETEVVVVDLPEKEEKALNLALNKISGSWEYGKLMLILDEMIVDPPEGMDIDTTGFSMEDIAELEARTKRGTAQEDDFNAEEEARKIKKAETKLGDLWQLGNHRLLCGDATKEENVKLLMGGGTAEMVFTDPPYGIEYKDLKGRFEELINDKKAKVPLLLKACFSSVEIPMYICCNWQSYPLFFSLIQRKEAIKAVIVWDKKRRIQNLDKFYKRHEFIIYLGPFGGEKTVDGDVWEVAREVAEDHPTQKPIELPFRAIQYSSMKGAIIYDPFAGSGTTLIAAEQLGRKAYLMEIDPVYCDVIVKRWEKFTGKEARLLNRPRGG